MTKITLFGDSLFNGFRKRCNTTLITDGLQARLASYAQVENISRSGATTVEGLDLLDQVDPNSDLVVIEYGTNDSSAWGISSESYRQNLSTMIHFFTPEKCIIVGPWHPKEANNFFDFQTINNNIHIAQNLAQENHCPFVNLSQITNGKNKQVLDQIYQEDNLHLTDCGNQLLLDLLTPVILTKLKKLGLA
ncbi:MULTISPECIES: GDSL-type esterase/lipase family protein [Lactobacillus]|uniref:SGNH/GDSL hydrolase family protein n=1 Tax=Lactobacillus xujianguonis TaxID=2495899 RepID=A0A437SUQ8_9LACO|nr:MULTISPECIES: GDSL-type esterase/lipase family protein [Lactobacillus]RVU70683.1 SGNH/GDSL hydrolase family protein [Lactobacillus xujianguonis]RVU77144.1 SGNH/GDSL hydrolase family protein [Lactobacillus xujianguonis]